SGSLTAKTRRSSSRLTRSSRIRFGPRIRYHRRVCASQERSIKVRNRMTPRLGAILLAGGFGLSTSVAASAQGPGASAVLQQNARRPAGEAGQVSGTPAAVPTRTTPASCQTLQQLKLDGLALTVTKTEWFAAGAPLPSGRG